MTTQRCFKCEMIKSVEEFYKHARRSTGYSNECKECGRIRKIEQRARFATANNGLIEAEAAKGCAICGTTDRVVLQFHHIEPLGGNTQRAQRMKRKGTTTKNPNDYLRVGTIKYKLPTERFKKYLEACVVLCANDHLRLHAGLVELP